MLRRHKSPKHPKGRPAHAKPMAGLDREESLNYASSVHKNAFPTLRRWNTFNHPEKTPLSSDSLFGILPNIFQK